MALPTASDNLFPKLNLDMQTSAPSAPAGEDWKMYAKADGIYARSSNAEVGPFGAAAALSFGSNAMAVGATSQAGTTGTYIGADHRHLGLHTVTSSSSNTLQRPTVNLRAGTGAALTASDSDGDGVLDTVTFHATGAGGGGSAVANVGRAVYTGGDKTTTSTTFVDVDASLSVTLTTGAHRCRVSVSAVGKNSGNQQTCIDVDLDGARLGGTFGLAFAGNTNNTTLSFSWVTAVLSAGSHTFKLQWRVDGGTGTLYGNTTTAPLQIAVEELQA